MHGGPFANIAHGCNSVRATRTALKMADYCITEAGFGADLGAEKFFDIKCRMAGLAPDAVVLVALNTFLTDTQAELSYVKEFCEERGCEFAFSEVWEKGGEGGIALAGKVLAALEKKSGFHVLYEDDLTLREKIEAVVKEIYGGAGVSYAASAAKQLAQLEKLGFGHLPVCMAKTQYSLSDDASLLGRPEGFTVNVREAYVSAGAGFVVVLTGAVMTMPGLPKSPAAFRIDVGEDGVITGLF